METLPRARSEDADQLRDLSATLLSQLADRDAQLASAMRKSNSSN